MNITAKILSAHNFPNIILFKIFKRINLNFGVITVAVDLRRPTNLFDRLNGSYLF